MNKRRKRNTKKQTHALRVFSSFRFKKLLDELQYVKIQQRQLRDMLFSFEKEETEIRYNLIKIIKIFKNKMNKTDWDILKMRFRGNKRLTLEEVAKKYGVSRERIRQRETKALDIIFNYIEKIC